MANPSTEKADPSKNILITGASGGIGAALANTYAEPNVQLFLQGRDKEKLNKVAKSCQLLGAKTQILIADVFDATYENTIKALSEQVEFDLVYVCAGQNLLETFASIDTNSIQHIQALMKVNFEGAVKTIFPLLEGLSKKQGRIVILSSVSAFRGLNQDPTYCASKAALSTFFEGCRATWSQQNIGVTLVYPGFVKTALSDSINSPKPFMLSASKAAQIIKTGVQKKKYRIVFPYRMRLLMNLQKLLPTLWVDKILLRS